VPNLGASGAIAGLVGAYILLFPHGKVKSVAGPTSGSSARAIVIGLWIVLQFFSGIGFYR
jgi:membrane associated rhomboid family serine protease